MRTKSASQKDSTFTVMPEIKPKMPWRVSEVKTLEGFRLQVRFIDGTEGEIDLNAKVHSPDAGVFARLTEPHLFAQAFVQYGAVTWPGEIDLAPDAMYHRIKRHPT